MMRALLWFAGRMAERLDANKHKKGWDDFQPQYFLLRLHEEVSELEIAMGESETTDEQIIREASDIANYAFFIANLARQCAVERKGFRI